ncbi:Glutamate--tRNA ligase 1 [bioreactor metagenome]|uniref:Glutamate--tRNA ligase 1 n=1 Tax=bioreactor metagenome TaxID=1076179 RepID=A0A645ALR4_9ZZZZ
MADMRWLGLDWDEGPDVGGPYAPYCQDERRELYQQALERLAAKGVIYPCYCTRAELAASAPHRGDSNYRYTGNCRNRSETPTDRRPALRLAVPEGIIQYEDLICGQYAQDVREISGDFVVRRSDGVHAYQLAVVVDDGLMNINNVVRGDDLLDSTPRQLLLYRLLGLTPPTFAHVPLLHGQDGHRLSKRQQDLSIAALRYRGVRAEDIIGYLGWKAGLIDRRCQVTAKDLINLFALEKLQTKPIIVENDCFLG